MKKDTIFRIMCYLEGSILTLLLICWFAIIVAKTEFIPTGILNKISIGVLFGIIFTTIIYIIPFHKFNFPKKKRLSHSNCDKCPNLQYNRAGKAMCKNPCEDITPTNELFLIEIGDSRFNLIERHIMTRKQLLRSKWGRKVDNPTLNLLDVGESYGSDSCFDGEFLVTRLK